jgi:hypothetical protein
MNTSQLEEIWQNIKYTGRYAVDFQRINSECVPELNIGINESSQRCLILELPSGYILDVLSLRKRNLSIEYFKEQNYIIITLLDRQFSDLFNDLTLSLFTKVKTIEKVDKYTKEFNRTFYKWSEFFEENDRSLLSDETIKGLIGELYVLKSLLLASSSKELSDILTGWKGPNDQRHDFILPGKNIEVKAKEPTGISIQISSEFQLEDELGKALELWVVNLERVDSVAEGANIRDLVEDIKQLIIDKLGDTVSFVKALGQKGLTVTTIPDYDRFRFRKHSEVVYDCNSPTFPKITKSTIPKAMMGVKYSLRTTGLTEFIITERNYQNGD